MSEEEGASHPQEPGEMPGNSSESKGTGSDFVLQTVQLGPADGSISTLATGESRWRCSSGSRRLWVRPSAWGLRGALGQRGSPPAGAVPGGGASGAGRCSNPRPTRRPGATECYKGAVRVTWWVPILARPGGRAQPRWHSTTNCMPKRFQSSPDPEAGRNPSALFRPFTFR